MDGGVREPGGGDFMGRKTFRAALAVVAALLGAVSMQSRAADGCSGYKWDVSKPRALYASAAVSVAAANDANAAPNIAVDKFYDLTLLDQAKVTFAVAPGKKQPTDGAFGGMVTFTVPSTGSYLVGLDAGSWIDVIADGKAVATQDFQGQRECDGPHKMVEFELAAGRHYLLQFSAGTRVDIKVTITEVFAKP
jgi:hypothetical protein